MTLKISNVQKISLTAIVLLMLIACLTAWPNLGRYADIVLSALSIFYILLPALYFSIWHGVYNNLTRVDLVARADTYWQFLRLIFLRTSRFRILTSLLISLSAFLDRASRAAMNSWPSEIIRFILCVLCLELSLVLMVLWMAILVMKLEKEHLALFIFLSYPLIISILKRRSIEGFPDLLPLPYFQSMPKHIARIEIYETSRVVGSLTMILVFLVVALVVLNRQFALGRQKALFIRGGADQERSALQVFVARHRQVLLLLHLPMVVVFLVGYLAYFRQVGAEAYCFSYYVKPFHWANFSIAKFFFWLFYRYWPILYLSTFLYDLIMRQGVILIPRRGRIPYFRKAYTDLVKLLILFYGIQTLSLELMVLLNPANPVNQRFILMLGILASATVVGLNALFWISLGNALLLRCRRLDLPILSLLLIILMDLWMAKSSELRVRTRWIDYLNPSSYAFPRIMEEEFVMPGLVWIIVAVLVNILAAFVVNRILLHCCRDLEIY